MRHPGEYEGFADWQVVMRYAGEYAGLTERYYRAIIDLARWFLIQHGSLRGKDGPAVSDWIAPSELGNAYFSYYKRFVVAANVLSAQSRAWRQHDVKPGQRELR